MSDFFKSYLPRVSSNGLILLAIDAEKRIGSYVADGDAANPYVER